MASIHTVTNTTQIKIQLQLKAQVKVRVKIQVTFVEFYLTFYEYCESKQAAVKYVYWMQTGAGCTFELEHSSWNIFVFQ